jgi:hypothetical protein
MRTMKIASLAAALGLIPVAGLAQQPINQETFKRHCTGDYLEHCGEFAPGGPEVEACFRGKIKKLSPNCSAAIMSHQREQAPVRKVNAVR